LAAENEVLLLYDERVLLHEPDAEQPFVPGRMEQRVRTMLSGLGFAWKYPEHPGRIRAILERLERDPIPGVRLGAGTAATREQLARVHTAAYLDTLDDMRGRNAWLDVDTTAVSPSSVEAAEVAAGTALAAAEAVVRGPTRRAFALVRPPGHHAEPVRARGFCLLNNVAVAAAHAVAELGVERVLVVDWDAHHGNGTQEIFWAEDHVLFFDTHQAAPFYPGSGHLEETGAGLGEGTTINVPLPAGTGDIAMLHAFRDILVPAAERFEPQLILVSAGFDAHRLDGAMSLGFDGFGAVTGVLLDLAERHCDGRIAFVLEGGYGLEPLAGGVHAVLRVLAGAEPPAVRECGVAEVEAAAAFHRTHQGL